VKGKATSLQVKLRGESGSAARGRKAELLAAEFFRNRGHQVEDCSHMNHQYDLVVSGYGKVQVKCVSQTKRRGNLELQCFMGSTAKCHYASDAFDWLCMVWITSKSAWIVLRSQSQCMAALDSRRMKSSMHMGVTKFRNLMQPVEMQVVTLFQTQ